MTSKRQKLSHDQGQPWLDHHGLQTPLGAADLCLQEVEEDEDDGEAQEDDQASRASSIAFDRGRDTRPRSRPATGAMIHGLVCGVDVDDPKFPQEWFSGQYLDARHDEGISTHNSGAMISSGKANNDNDHLDLTDNMTTINPFTLPLTSRRHARKTSYPIYMPLDPRGTQEPSCTMLVSGSWCRIVMILHDEESLSAPAIADLLTGMGMDLSRGDVEDIIRTCRHCGLDKDSPLMADGWLLKSEAKVSSSSSGSEYGTDGDDGDYSAEDNDLSRREPVSAEIFGNACDGDQDEWWVGRQKKENRDWTIWGEREIGPSM